jgi:hypothetical protein
VQSNDSAYMNVHGTLSATTWLNVVMLFMNMVIWCGNALQLAG